MSKIKLHKLIFRPEILRLLDSAAGRIKLPFSILDPDGNVIIKNFPDGIPPTAERNFPITLGGTPLGSVRGDDNAVIIADLVVALAQSEFDKKAIAGEALHRYKELALLYDLSDRISAQLDVVDTARVIIEEAQRLVPGDNFSVMLRPPGGEYLEVAAASGRDNPSKVRMRSGEGLAGSIYASGKAEIINDVNSDKRHLTGPNKLSSLICAPLTARQEVIGVLNISSEEPHEYSSEDLKLTIALSLFGAQAISSARYTQELRRSRDQLEALVTQRTRKLEKTLLELTRTNKFLEHISMADALTGVGNRRSFDQLLDNEWRRAAREGRPLSLVLVDLDYFKAYNDTYGHQAGDQCLVRVVNCMRATLKRPTDSIARYGGEEFAVVLANTDTEGALRTATALINDIERMAITHMGSQIADHVTASAGVATIAPETGMTVPDLIKMADLALYTSKQNGRNQVQEAPREEQESE